MNRSGLRPAGRVVLCLGLWLALGASTGSCGWDVTVSMGDVFTPSCDVRWRTSDTERVYEEVKWTSDPWVGAPYYNVRAGFWPKATSHWGVSLELNHFKIVSDRRRAVRQRGQTGGTPVDSTAPLAASFEALDFSNGNNLVVAGVLWRGPLRPEEPQRFAERWQGLLGAGAGVSVPFVNVASDGRAVRDYRLGGTALQFLAGGAATLSERVAIVVLYKLSHSRLSVDVEGARLELHPWSHHVTLGLRFVL